MMKQDPFIEKHLNRIRTIQALNGGKRLFVECFPTDEGANQFPNSNFAVKEIFIEDVPQSPSPVPSLGVSAEEMISDAQEILYLNVPANCYDNELQCLVNCPEKYVLNAMSLYASSREDTIRELKLLIELQGKYINWIEETIKAAESIAFIHGFVYDQKILNEGVRMRHEIKLLSQQKDI